MAIVKNFNADFSSRNISLRWPIYVINLVDNAKLPCYTLPPTQQHSFFVRKVTYKVTALTDCSYSLKLFSFMTIAALSLHVSVKHEEKKLQHSILELEDDSELVKSAVKEVKTSYSNFKLILSETSLPHEKQRIFLNAGIVLESSEVQLLA